MKDAEGLKAVEGLKDELLLRYYKPLTVTVSEQDAGKEVRTVLERRLGVSRKLLSQVKLTEHGLTLNEERVYTTAKVSAGDIIRVRMEREQSDDILPQDLPLDILFEDEDLLVVNKPAGVIVHPTHGHYTGTLANGVVYHWLQRGEKVRFRPVHRLDEETSGVVAIAKTGYVHQQLSEQMQRGEVDKRYLAYVYGAPPAPTGVVDEPIDRDPESPHIRIVTPTGYPSLTRYEAVKHFGGGPGEAAATLVKLKLETGRTHQIRVHMKHLGCPLIGDKMYGADANEITAWEDCVNRQALHAASLGFVHPLTGEKMEFHAPLPPELTALEALLKQHSKHASNVRFWT
ncbi:RluA family pseudouridine synthase [Paenibacillus oryzae]|uniref:RluA family pseudouridine synthase n=1 Tax=Paenibacillus oryzae TaxID=1844972 RepID=UPI000B280DAA|nr:RluA family pseudouridine synthase [Paenibacillus oryzae]